MPRMQQDGRVARESRPIGIRSPWLALAAGAVGGGVFAWTLGRAGYDQVLESIRSLGWIFVIVLGLGGLRFALRALAWMTCVERPARLAFRDAFAAFLAGDALGTLSPVGLLASEPTKILLATGRLPSSVAVSSVAIENILYSLSVAMMIAGGALVFLYSAPADGALKVVSQAAVASFLIGIFVLAAVATTRRRPLRALTRLALRWPANDRLTRLVQHLAQVEARVLGFASGGTRRWFRTFGLETAYHGVAVLEVWVTLSYILPREVQPTLLHAFLLEAMNRFITVMFKFVPLRVGVDEAGTGLATSALALGPVPGVTLALLRKARILCWTAVGVVVLLTRGWSPHAGSLVDSSQEPQLQPDASGR